MTWTPMPAREDVTMTTFLGRILDAAIMGPLRLLLVHVSDRVAGFQRLSVLFYFRFTTPSATKALFFFSSPCYLILPESPSFCSKHATSTRK